MAVINTKDIANPKLFDPLIEGAKEYVVALDAAEEAQLKNLKASEKYFRTVKSISNAADLKEFQKQIQSTDEQVKDLNQTRQASAKVQKQIKDLTDEQVKAKLRFNKVNKEQRDELKALIVLEDEQAGTEEKLLATNQLLRKERKKLNTETVEGQKRLKEINKQLDQNNKQLKENADSLKRQRLNVGNYAESIIEAQKALEKQKVSLESNINALKIAQKQTSRTKEEQDEINKELKEAEKTYQQVNVQLNQYNINQQKNTKVVGQFRKGVGAASLALKALGTAAVIGIIAKIGEFFSTSTEGSIELQKKIAQLTARVKVFVGSLLNGLSGIKDILSSVGDKFVIFGKNVKLAGLDIASIFSDDAEKSANNLRKEIEELSKASGEGLKTGLDKVSKAFDNFDGRVEATIKVSTDLIEKTAKYNLEIEKLERNLTNTRAQQELANQTADDATLSFKERIEATKEVAKLNADIADQEEKIALKQLELSELALRRDLAAADISVGSRAQLIAILKDESKAFKTNADDRRAFTDAFVALEEAKAGAEIARFEQSKQNRELEQDLREKDLDILIDGADNLKTINERIIADETQTLALRRVTLKQTEDFIEESFKKQIDTLQGFTDKSIDANDLLKESDAELLNDKIRLLGLSEILEGRLLEVIRERRTATQDLAEANRDLAESEREANEIRKDIIAQEEALLSGDTDKLQEQRLQNEINGLKERLEVAEEGSKEQLEIQQDLNDKLLEQQKQRIDKEKEADKKALKDKQEQQKKVFDTAEALTEFSIQQSDKRIEAIDKEISANEKKQDRLRELADKGSADAARSLAIEEQRAAEALQEKARLERQKRIQEQALLAIETYRANLQAAQNTGSTTPSKDALSQTFQDTSLLLAFVNGLSGFYEGTDTTVEAAMSKKGVKPFASKDGYLAKFDGKEKVLNPKLSQMTGNATTRDIVDGYLESKRANPEFMTKVYEDFHAVKTDQGGVELLTEIRKQNELLQDLPSRMPKQDLLKTISNGVKYLTEETKVGPTVTRRHKRWRD